MQLSREGKCLACNGGGWKKDESKITAATDQNDFHQCRIIFTNANLKYSGRLDDKQGGDTIVTMGRLAAAAAIHNVELADDLI